MRGPNFPARTSWRLLAVRASFSVDALIGQAQSLHGLAANQVLLYDFRRVLRLHVSVPYRLRVHHHCGPMLALVKAA
jgi:hypothetical protein